MRRVMLWLGVLACALGLAQPPSIQAKSAVLMEASNGQVLYAKHARKPLPPASLTKIMTALIVLERCELDEVVTASENAVNTQPSSMNLRVGEQVKVRDLLYALMLRSANDSAVALAEHVAGSVEAFAQLMNQRANELGANQTHFVNPHGLHAPNHYSTAYDLALIARQAMQNETLRQIVGERYYIVERSINQDDLWMVNKAKFLQMYPYAEGLKTGYTRPAGFCFAGSAFKDGRRLIAIVLNSDQREQDTIALMEHGFNDWMVLHLGDKGTVVGKAPIEGGMTDSVPVRLTQPALYVVPTQLHQQYRWQLDLPSQTAPIQENQPVGYAVLWKGDTALLKVPLVATSAVQEKPSVVGTWASGLLFVGALGGLFWLRFTRHRRRRYPISRQPITYRQGVQPLGRNPKAR